MTLTRKPILHMWWILVLFTKCCIGSNILFLSPITAPSHSSFFKPVVQELARKGHTVTYWNGLKPDPSLDQNENISQLYSPEFSKFNDNHDVRFEDRNHPYLLFIAFYDRTVNYCNAIYRDPIFLQLMTGGEHFDLVIIEGILNECVLPLVSVLNAPFVYMVGISPTPWLLNAVASPQAFAQLPLPGLCFTDRMSFIQRTMNMMLGLFTLFFRKWVLMSAVDRIAAEVLPSHLATNLTSVIQIEEERLSLLISNSHPSITYGMPKSPAFIEAGGLHCRAPKPLPQDLEKFVNASGNAGFIIVSFGSILRGSNMPKDIQRIFITVFGRLQQRVIWKWEESSAPSLKNKDQRIPDNVKLMSWLPQQDLLGHPKARLFITHGGLFSNQEAVYHGVPLIALPVFADQPINAQKIHDDGYGILLNWDNLTEQNLYEAIQEILINTRYKIKMDEVSSLMRDQPEQPLDRAVYWLEFIIRHKGAPHVRTAARNLSILERGMVDVILFFAAIATMALLLVLYFTRIFALKLKSQISVSSSSTTRKKFKNKSQ